MPYLDRKDYLGFAMIGAYTMCGYYLSRLLDYNSLITVLIVLIMVMASILISKIIYTASNKLKIILILIPFLLLIIASLIKSKPAAQVSADFNGLWITDDRDGLAVKLRKSENDSIFLSMSPEFVEVDYFAVIEDNIILLERHGEVKLKWQFNYKNDSVLILEKNSKELIFRRMD